MFASRCNALNCTHAHAHAFAQLDPSLEVHCRELVTAAARGLHASKMAVFDERSGNMCGGAREWLFVFSFFFLFLSVLSEDAQRACSSAHSIPSPVQTTPPPLTHTNTRRSYVTELGRVASHYYVRAPSIVVFNERLKPRLREEDVLAMMALSSEFESMAVRWAGGLLASCLCASRGDFC